MRKYLVILVLFILVMLAAVSFGREKEYESVRIYFADAQIMKLIGVETQVEKGDAESVANEVVSVIIEGHDDNKKIRRVLPKVKNGISVKVNDGIAYVDIKEEMVQKQEKSRVVEAMAIYSIVNSLTGIEGIEAVNFSIDGMPRKEYAGFLDMRRTFTYSNIY